MELWKRSWSTHRERKELLTAEVPSKGEGRSMGYKCAKMFAEIKVMVRQKKNTGIYFWTWEFLSTCCLSAPSMHQGWNRKEAGKFAKVPGVIKWSKSLSPFESQSISLEFFDETQFHMILLKLTQVISHLGSGSAIVQQVPTFQRKK